MTILLAVIAIATPTPTPVMQACQTRACERRVHRRHMRKTIRPYRPWLRRTAQCESGGRWHIATGNGFYGGLQFTLQSWRAVGGAGMPHRASRLEQMYRGVRLLKIQGRGAWPVCG
jgi:hypothetical protein